ncbi:MAG TPA: hypothetical protein IAB33_08325 [Candidatus Pelethomonas intestinigallinarum]|nr:hypothetical protein [Candidatus Pelethomonas intestinigallinarum]
MGGRVARWQLGGFLFVCAAGTALHFLYQWSGESVAAAPFAAVNESVWEHMKLLFWPMLLWAGAERAVLGGYSRGFWPAKALGTLLGLALIPALYYTYTGALDVSVMWVDIAIFFVAAAAAFLAETRMLARDWRCRGGARASALVLLLLLSAAFVLCTFVPPRFPLFRDPVTGFYGLGQ